MSNALTRVGTANMYDNALRNLGERQSSLVGLQENLTAGKRVVRPSDSAVSSENASSAVSTCTTCRSWRSSMRLVASATTRLSSTYSTVAPGTGSGCT